MLNTWKEKLGFGKDKGLTILSPVAGKAYPLSEVNDPVFSDKIVGDGLAILPEQGRVVAPFDGTVTMLFETKHAISIRSEQGVEVLIHIGLDTVNLKGEHYTAKVKTGDTVSAGDLLLEFDMKQITEAGYELMTPVIICNTADYSEIISYTGSTVSELDKIMTIKK